MDKQPFFHIVLNGSSYACHPGETVLDALLRQGADFIPYACRQQNCKSCLLRALDTPPPAAAQKNLRDTQKAQNFFLACGCVPERDMEIALADLAPLEIAATVVDIEKLNEKMFALTLQCETPFNYHAGQSILVRNEDRVGKNYFISSPSSCKRQGLLEVHVPLLVDDFFARYLSFGIKPGGRMTLFGLTGQSFYLADDLTQPLLLLGEQQGLSALVGIMQDALEQGHSGTIHLFHGVEDAEELYLAEDLRDLTEYYGNFHYHPCVYHNGSPADRHPDGALGTVLNTLETLSGWRVFIAGESPFVKNAQKTIYLAGAATKDIYPIYII